MNLIDTHAETAAPLERAIPALQRIDAGQYAWQLDAPFPIDVLVDSEGLSVQFSVVIDVPCIPCDAELFYALLRLNAQQNDRKHYFAFDETTMSIVVCAIIKYAAILAPGVVEQAAFQLIKAARDAIATFGESVSPR